MRPNSRRNGKMEGKLEKLKDKLRGYASVAVAYSGGVDSTYLLKVAHDVLGAKCAGFIVVSPFVPSRDVAGARDWCRKEGVRLVEIPGDPTEDPSIAANPPDRCYHCRKAEYLKILQATRTCGFDVVCDGANSDDAGDFRPGARAAAELGVKSPLKDCSFSKDEIRALSRRMGLPTWDKPAAACLASRIPYGEPVTKAKLRTVDAAEEFLSRLGFSNLRVRLHGGNLARIEVPQAEMEKVLDSRGEIVREFARMGVRYATLDLKGYRMGSMNEVLASASEIADRIIAGGGISRDEALCLLKTSPRNALHEAAHRVTDAMASRKFDFCSIVNARCGKCGEDCKWCAQSARWNTGIESYGWIGTERCVEAARRSEAMGAGRIGIVTSGRSQTPAQIDEICAALREMKRTTKIHLCASLGLVGEDDLRRLKDAGLEVLHCNLETAPSRFGDLCSTHSQAEKIATLKAARRTGLGICCGGIIGMGETDEQLVEFAFALADLAPDSIPVNILRPVEGTPLGKSKILDEGRILDSIAVLRLVNPRTSLRFAGGRTQLSDDGARRAVYVGINAGIAGPMLTTPGPRYSDDRSIAEEAGYEVRQELRP